jgi:hypothetical protein
MRFQYTLNFRNYTESIKYWYARDIFEIDGVYGSEERYITAPLFNSICDLLSVDFKLLIDGIYKYFISSPTYEESEIFDILNSSNFLLTESSIIKEIATIIEEYSDYVKIGIEEDFKQEFYNRIFQDCFCKFALLNFYVKEYKNYSILNDPDNFSYFALSASGADIAILNDDLEELNDYTECVSLDNCDKATILKYLDRSLKPALNVVNRYEEGALNFYATCIHQIIKHGYIIKQCENCGKYFVAYNRSDTLYCDRISPKDPSKTCKEFGKYINYLNKNKNDESTKLYKQIYNIKANRYRRTKTKTYPKGNLSLKKDLDSFTAVGSKWKQDVKLGCKSEEQYISWLKKVKEGVINGDDSKEG